MSLYHFTCHHGRDALGDRGVVLPITEFDPVAAARIPAPMSWLAGLSWFTDQARPDAGALGLTSLTIRCDRTAHRYRVTDPAGVRRWLDVWREYGPNARTLNLAPDGRPGTWFVATAPVPVVWDPEPGDLGD